MPNTTEQGKEEQEVGGGNHSNQTEEVLIGNHGTNELPRRKSLWMTMRSSLRIVDEGATPLNWKHVFLVFISLFCSAVSLTFLFPFLPEMIVSFGYQEEDKGYYAGLVASAVFAGRAMGSYFWGWLSDRVGRRPVMLVTIFGNGFFSFVFGFTYNIPMAIVSRFLTGLANGTVGAAKTMLYEICDNTNQALGMSIISVAWGAGIVLGPTAGGLLSSPAKRYPQTFSPDGVFGQYPYLLPSMLIFIVCLLVDVLDFFLLPETLISKKKDHTNPKKLRNAENDDETEKIPLASETEDNQHNKDGRQVTESDIDHLQPKIALSVEDLHCESEAAIVLLQREARTGHSDILRQQIRSQLSHGHRNRTISLGNMPSDKSKQDYAVDAAHISKSSHELNWSNQSGHTRNGSLHLTMGADNSCSGEYQIEGSEMEQPKGCCGQICYKLRNTSLIKLFRMGDVRQAVMLYTIFSFGAIGFEEIFTVWASTEHRFDGLNYAPDKIGAVLGISAIPLLMLNLFLFPFLARKFGLKKAFGGCTLVLTLVITVMPMLHLIHNQETLLMVLLIVITMPQKLLTACCFSATSLFVNNSAPPNQAGAVNGIAMTMTAIARSLAPTIGGSIFAWSIGYGAEKLGPPFDVNLAFFFFGFVIWSMVIFAVFLNDSLNNQKK